MKTFLNIVGSTVYAALVGILAGQVFEDGLASPYWWGCVAIAIVATLLQRIRPNEKIVYADDTEQI